MHVFTYFYPYINYPLFGIILLLFKLYNYGRDLFKHNKSTASSQDKLQELMNKAFRVRVGVTKHVNLSKKV